MRLGLRPANAPRRNGTATAQNGLLPRNSCKLAFGRACGRSCIASVRMDFRLALHRRNGACEPERLRPRCRATEWQWIPIPERESPLQETIVTQPPAEAVKKRAHANKSARLLMSAGVIYATL